MNRADSQKPNLRARDRYVARNRAQALWKRTMSLSHGRTQAELLRKVDVEGKSVFHRAKDYLDIQVASWAWHYLKSRFGGKWTFADYGAFADDNGIYDLARAPGSSGSPTPVVVSLVGDWGSGTEDALQVAQRVNDDAPHFTVHLGDVYFVGTKEEIRENMLGGRVQWPLGSRGSFALNANHEMYAQGKGYFKYLLPALGLFDSHGEQIHGQRASFFALRNEHWLVIGLDTGYYSVGLPVLEQIIQPSAKLHAKILEWLRRDIRLPDDRQRGVILLSHHQYYSQFEGGYERPAIQLADLIDRPVLWFWGHEHRLALYGKHATPKGKLQVYGRCLGHGGLPIEDINQQPRCKGTDDVGLVLYDTRQRTEVGDLKTPVGFNGFATLAFEGSRLTVDYKDTRDTLLRERWEVGRGGVLRGIAIERLVDDPDLRVHEGADLQDAIQ